METRDYLYIMTLVLFAIISVVRHIRIKDHLHSITKRQNEATEVVNLMIEVLLGKKKIREDENGSVYFENVQKKD